MTIAVGLGNPYEISMSGRNFGTPKCRNLAPQISAYSRNAGAGAGARLLEDRKVLCQNFGRIRQISAKKRPLFPQTSADISTIYLDLLRFYLREIVYKLAEDKLWALMAHTVESIVPKTHHIWMLCSSENRDKSQLQEYITLVIYINYLGYGIGDLW